MSNFIQPVMRTLDVSSSNALWDLQLTSLLKLLRTQLCISDFLINEGDFLEFSVSLFVLMIQPREFHVHHCVKTNPKKHRVLTLSLGEMNRTVTVHSLGRHFFSKMTYPGIVVFRKEPDFSKKMKKV